MNWYPLIYKYIYAILLILEMSNDEIIRDMVRLEEELTVLQSDFDTHERKMTRLSANYDKLSAVCFLYRFSALNEMIELATVDCLKDEWFYFLADSNNVFFESAKNIYMCIKCMRYIKIKWWGGKGESYTCILGLVLWMQNVRKIMWFMMTISSKNITNDCAKNTR